MKSWHILIYTKLTKFKIIVNIKIKIQSIKKTDAKVISGMKNIQLASY